METYGIWIAGEAKPGRGKRTKLIAPATGRQFATLAEASQADLDEAIEIADNAFRECGWHHWEPLKRAQVLNDCATALRADSDRLARLETLNVGRPLKETLRNVELAADAFAYFASLTTHIRGATIPLSADLFDYTVREPYGVCGVITPWNNPLVLSAWKLAAGLAAGNALVVKPASLTPITLLCMAQTLHDAGLPAGMLNVLPGPGVELGQQLAAHPLIRKISFTGSTDVGKQVMRAAAEHLVRVSLELGGKSPSIVFADADLDQAAVGSIPAMFANAGQMCTARSRMLVDARIYEEFLAKLTEQVSRLKVGDPFLPETHVGPVISQGQLESVLGFLQRAVAEGARVAVGGHRAVAGGLDTGFFVEPTLLTDVHDTMEVVREEIFGPVLVIDRFSTEAEAIRRANDTRYGLSATIWTRDLARAHRVAGALEVGTVTVNTTKVSHVYAPFGGYKASGIGRELGLEGLSEFLQYKNVIMAIPAD